MSKSKCWAPGGQNVFLISRGKIYKIIQNEILERKKVWDSK